MNFETFSFFNYLFFFTLPRSHGKTIIYRSVQNGLSELETARIGPNRSVGSGFQECQSGSLFQSRTKLDRTNYTYNFLFLQNKYECADMNTSKQN